jgi:hypothetical protein
MCKFTGSLSSKQAPRRHLPQGLSFILHLAGVWNAVRHGAFAVLLSLRHLSALVASNFFLIHLERFIAGDRLAETTMQNAITSASCCNLRRTAYNENPSSILKSAQDHFARRKIKFWKVSTSPREPYFHFLDERSVSTILSHGPKPNYSGVKGTRADLSSTRPLLKKSFNDLTSKIVTQIHHRYPEIHIRSQLSSRVHVIKSYTNTCLMVTVVLSNSFTRSQLPKSCNVIGRRCTAWQHCVMNKICANRTESTLPVTRYAESALNAASQTHRWWPCNTFAR